jgi:hypothetical protein
MSVSYCSVKPCLLILVRLAFVLSPAFCSVRIGAQQPSVTVKAELVQPLAAGPARVGDTVKARVQVAWTDPTCTLKQNAMVTGRIVAQGSSVRGTSGHNLRLETGVIMVLARSADAHPAPGTSPVNPH